MIDRLRIAGIAARLAAALLGVSVLAAASGAAAAPAAPDSTAADTLRFAPARPDTSTPVEVLPDADHAEQHTPHGQQMFTDTDTWQWWSRPGLQGIVDYNRVDRLRLGLGTVWQVPGTLYPEIGARFEIPFDRAVTGYGLQIEQPLIAPGFLAVGASMVRRTDHPELQQVDDIENSLNLLLAKLDYRDYWEREGFGAYAVLRIPHITMFSAQARSDQYRSLPLIASTRSWFFRDRPLRDNPAIDDGEAHLFSLRLEHHAHDEGRLRPGLHHWIDYERAGHGMGGDFSYSRLLADVRSVLRLAPALTLAIRGVGGHAFDGTLPRQREFPLGGPDGLRAHDIAQYHGSQLALGQAELTLGLWRARTQYFEGGLHAIAFIESGAAWDNPGHQYDLDRQQLETDAGFGIGTSADHLRVYFAKNLREPGSNPVVTVRLTRPF